LIVFKKSRVFLIFLKNLLNPFRGISPVLFQAEARLRLAVDFTNTFQKFAKKTNFFFVPDVFYHILCRALKRVGVPPPFEKRG
jgi:hypothetical protein